MFWVKVNSISQQWAYQQRDLCSYSRLGGVLGPGVFPYILYLQETEERYNGSSASSQYNIVQGYIYIEAEIKLSCLCVMLFLSMSF